MEILVLKGSFGDKRRPTLEVVEDGCSARVAVQIEEARRFDTVRHTKDVEERFDRIRSFIGDPRRTLESCRDELTRSLCEGRLYRPKVIGVWRLIQQLVERRLGDPTI